MSKPPVEVIALSDTLSLSRYPDTSGHRGWWLWDATQGMNLSMRAPTKEDALLEALKYYQKRLGKVEADHTALTKAVDAFVDIVRPEQEQEDSY